MYSHALGLPVPGEGADAVDPQQPVEQSTHTGENQAKNNPTEGRPGIALVQQSVTRRQHRGQQKKPPKENHQ
jgi:hypothetical protein